MNFAKLILICISLLFPAALIAQEKPAESPREPIGGPTGIFKVANGGGLRRAESSQPELRTEKLDSKLMGREMPFRVIVPMGYSDAANSAKRYPVIFLLHGLTGSHRNWTDLAKLTEYAKVSGAIIVTPEGENGWYTDGATNEKDKYESYIIKEVIPEIDKRFRTIADRKNRVIAGLSMGGYGAVKFGLKYPEMFSLVGSFSGALGAARLSVTERSPASMRSLNVIFGAADSETRQNNDIFKKIREITPEKIKPLPFLYIDCGTEDFLFQNNREFIDLLIEKKVPHEYRQLPGGHNWPYWNKQVQEFLMVAERNFRTN